VTLPRWVFGGNPRLTAIRALTLVGSAYIVFGFVLLPVRGAGTSMAPTIESGDLIFINRLAYRFREPRRGDVVAVRMAGPSVVYVKRLIALPGDRVKIDHSAVSINGKAVEEPYARKGSDWWLEEALLGPDQYFVVGDNRTMPMHLHEMGTVTKERLIGPLAF
jgi:signal peptidase I